VPTTTVDRGQALEQAMRCTELLATEIGGRRPTSIEERRAAELVAELLRTSGVAAELERFAGYPTFAATYGPILGAATLSGLLPRRRVRALRALATSAAAAALVTEGGLVFTPLSDRLSTSPSRNLVATIEPRGAPRRTLCLVSHLDTSRSGLIFHPNAARLLHPVIVTMSAAVLAIGAEPLLDRLPGGRALLRLARGLTAAGLALLAERELRGQDVPGANDNASGVGVTAQLAAEAAADPLESTRLVLLATGCEEVGSLGMRAFLRSRDTTGWLFLNFDGVAAPATLRYCEQEGLVQKWAADPGLLAIAAGISRERPDLGLAPAGGPIGLTYDATPVLARGGRALTLVAGDGGVIPNYHQPSDTVANAEPDRVAAALEVGRELIAAVERGEAD
jgi:hypothetical protein